MITLCLTIKNDSIFIDSVQRGDIASSASRNNKRKHTDSEEPYNPLTECISCKRIRKPYKGHSNKNCQAKIAYLKDKLGKTTLRTKNIIVIVTLPNQVKRIPSLRPYQHQVNRKVNINLRIKHRILGINIISLLIITTGAPLNQKLTSATTIKILTKAFKSQQKMLITKMKPILHSCSVTKSLY